MEDSSSEAQTSTPDPALSHLIRQGIARQQQGDFAAAEESYRAVLATDPEHPDALHLLGLIALEAGRPATAIDLIRRAIKFNMHNPLFHHNLGIIYESRSDNEAAIISNQRALYLNPDFFGARFSLANQFRATGLFEDAIQQYRHAAELKPDSAEVSSNLGAALEALGRHDEAIVCHRRARELAPDNAMIATNLGAALQSSGELDEAMAEYRKAIELDSSFSDAYANLAEALLQTGDAAGGLAMAEQCRQVDPGNRAAIALYAIASNALGNDAQRDRLLDPALTMAVDIAAPANETSDTGEALREFNEALCLHVFNHPTLDFEPTRKSTRNGKQTGELLVAPKGPVTWLEEQIRAAVTQYIADTPADSDHPFLRHKPENWNLAVWATVLDRSGHQLPHIHPSAWLSGVYYASVPPQDGDKESGWLEFGHPPAHLEYLKPMPTRRMEPVPGRMYLFPSYFYHRTIPFKGDEPRVSIAFDVVPVPGIAQSFPLSADDVDELLARSQGYLNDGDRAQAREHAEHALAHNPREHRALHLLAAVARSDGLAEQSADHLRSAVAIDPENARYHWELSEILQKLQRYEASAESLQKALELGLSNPQIYTHLGSTLSDMGKFDEAIDAFKKALDEPKTMGTAYYGMSLVSGFQGDAELIKTMQKELEREELTDRERHNLHFALGRAYMGQRDADSAFEHFVQGNEIQHRNKTFKLEVERENTRRIIRAFDKSTFSQNVGSGDPSDQPVFIIGMPRSGTTLVEQIIASHPRAHGAGEINDLWRIVSRITTFLPPGGALPDDVASIRRDAWRMLAEQYLKKIRQYSPQAARITDKLPFNYTLAGIINLMLPNAKIIHCRRNPLDTCVSCFTIGFGSDRGFTGDLRDLGGTYRTYQDLMAHWHDVMPGRIYDIEYESLVADTENQARGLIEHIGLEWDDACLEFHQHKRMVSTASVAQVRKPVYKSSIERWRLFEKHLDPLIMALEEDY